MYGGRVLHCEFCVCVALHLLLYLNFIIQYLYILYDKIMVVRVLWMILLVL